MLNNFEILINYVFRLYVYNHFIMASHLCCQYLGLNLIYICACIQSTLRFAVWIDKCIDIKSFENVFAGILIYFVTSKSNVCKVLFLKRPVTTCFTILITTAHLIPFAMMTKNGQMCSNILRI